MTSNPHKIDARPGSLRGLRKLSVALIAANLLLVSPQAAFASLLPPEMEDALAKWSHRDRPHVRGPVLRPTQIGRYGVPSHVVGIAPPKTVC